MKKFFSFLKNQTFSLFLQNELTSLITVNTENEVPLNVIPVILQFQIFKENNKNR